MAAKVLVVDDTLEALQLLRIMLEANGYDPVTALTAAKGLRLAKEEGPQAALLDLLMPEVDGLELTRQLRADPDTANIGILIVTAVNEPEVEGRAREAGADGLLYKPIDMADLLATLGQILEERGDA